MVTPEDRVEHALAALVEDERRIGNVDSALDMSRRLFGDLSTGFIQGLVNGVESFARKLFTGLEDDRVAAYLVFLAGVRVGKQLGIAEGASLPSLEAIYED